MFWICLVKYVVLWFIIGFKCLIKAWGWSPILFLAFWGTLKFLLNVGPWTPYLLQKYFKKKTQVMLANIMFCKYETLEHVWKMRVPQLWKFSNCMCLYFKSLEL